MADFSRFNFFNKLDARARVLVLLGGVIAIGLVIYFISRYLSGNTSNVGPSRVANAPVVQSNIGGQLTPEYQRTLMQANQQIAQQAQVTGGSAQPTVINYGQQAQPAPTQNCIVCSDDVLNNVKTDLDAWVAQGKLSPEIANELAQLADKNVPVSEYAAYLDKLVKEGKLTPEQARLLLDKYKKQHANRLLNESAQVLDPFIKNGTLPIDVANDLLDLQKKPVSPTDYAAYLQELVRQGKITPEMAQQLLAQYTQQRAREVTEQSIASLHRMAQNGEITNDVEAQLTDLEKRMVSVDLYNNNLQTLLTSGKITPIAAKKILEEFKTQKAAIGPTGSLNKILENAEAAAYKELNDLLNAKKISEQTAAEIGNAIKKNVSMEQFLGLINQLQQSGNLTPEIAKLKIADYRLVKGLRDEIEKLNALQSSNASAAAYADELKRAVQLGLITPDEAKQLMQEYLAMLTKLLPPLNATAKSTAFAELQQRTQAAAAQGQVVSADQFAAAQTQAEAESAVDRQTRIQNMIAAMSNQAQALIASWQPPTMEHKAGIEETKELTAATQTTTTTTTTSPGGGTNAGEKAKGPAIIKAGTILFAVLDTTANSDYPDSPILATVVEGKYKGARLLGKLLTAKGVSGQMDRISLTFTKMDTPEWTNTKSVTAYAIDPDTARTVMASEVDHHYALRFGAIMATSFMQGYASAITNAGTSTTGIFGTSTTHPELSPGNKLAVGFGQIGQTLGQVTQNYVNIPPTVRVNAGVGLGILFMDDVTL